MRSATLAASLMVASCTTANMIGGDALPQRITAIGTEPFWSFALDGSTLVFSEPEKQDRTAQARRTAIDGRTIIEAMAKGEPFRAEITRAVCSDGMSDRTYPFAVTVVLGERKLHGCAAPRDHRN